MSKTYLVSDLFHTSWKALKAKQHAEVFGMHAHLEQMKPSQKEYGYQMIAILRRLRRNPSLVDKITEVQAVDIFNDLTFLKQPWYHFPVRQIRVGKVHLVAPDELMGRHTFDHFIYGDNEFTHSLLKQETHLHHLRRLAATIYVDPGERTFDRECVDHRVIYMTAQDWELELIAATYAHIRSFITSRCKHLMPAPAKPADQVQHQVTATGPMWQELKHRLAETPAFQGFDKAGSANIYDCLDYLEGLAKTQNRKQHA